MEKIDWEKFKVDGVDYTPEGIEELRQELIGYRTDAMNQQAWQPVMVLSHTIAVLAYLIEMINMQRQEGEPPEDGWMSARSAHVLLTEEELDERRARDESQRQLDANPELSGQIDKFLADPSKGVRRGRPIRRGSRDEDA